jgi:D-3-phosphoglycerate dehydrogenase
VVGLGAIGSMVARAALDLGMEVLGYDPAISVDAAWRLPAEVQRMENLPSLFARADYVTLHVPLLPETEGMINESSLRMFRPGSVLLNFARQPIVEARALRTALDDGRLARYVADFPVPELIVHPRVLLTPHLGASTDEAEENCAVMAATQLVDFLRTGNIRTSGNFPTVILEPAGGHRLAVTNRNVPGVLNQVTQVLAERQINVMDMINKSRGDVAYNLIDVVDPLDPPTMDALCALDQADGPCTWAKDWAKLSGSALTMKLTSFWRKSVTSLERWRATASKPMRSNRAASRAKAFRDPSQLFAS